MKKLSNKIEVFKKTTGTHKQLFLALISANGIKSNSYSKELVSQAVTLDDLYKEI